MSNREIAIQMLKNMPEYKVGYVLAYMQGLNADDIADDMFCSSLVENYENSEDKGEFMPFDEAMKTCGVDPNEIQY